MEKEVGREGVGRGKVEKEGMGSYSRDGGREKVRVEREGRREMWWRGVKQRLRWRWRRCRVRRWVRWETGRGHNVSFK